MSTTYTTKQVEQMLDRRSKAADRAFLRWNAACERHGELSKPAKAAALNYKCANGSYQVALQIYSEHKAEVAA